MKFLRGGVPVRGRSFGLAAAALAAGLALSGAAAADPVSPYFQNYQVNPLFDVSSIALYDGGLSNSFQAFAPSTLITNPFVRTTPIEATYFLGVSTLGSEDESPAPHLVLALSDLFAADLVGGGLDFTSIFAGYEESSLIDALVLLDTPDLAADDPGLADQLAAKDAAYDLLFNFSDTVVGQGGAFGSVDTFTLVSFSSASPFGGGFTFTTAAPGAVPEPAAWALMIVGFGGVGALIRRRRRWDTCAAA